MRQFRARDDIMVVGIGNPLREDDRAGIEVVESLASHFGPELNSQVVYEQDICLAETIAAFKHLIIVDAIESDSSEPFAVLDVHPSKTFLPDMGVTAHTFSWGMVLAMARDLYGHMPQARVLTITATNFGISDKISLACEANAQKALEQLIEMVKEK